MPPLDRDDEVDGRHVALHDLFEQPVTLLIEGGWQEYPELLEFVSQLEPPVSCKERPENIPTLGSSGPSISVGC